MLDQVIMANPPETLWRVSYKGNADAVLRARAPPQFRSWDEYQEIKKLHLQWISRVPTPFLSTFSSREHAMNWARKQHELHNDNTVAVIRINTRGLTVIYPGGNRFNDDEFFILDEIPANNLENREYLYPQPAAHQVFQFANPNPRALPPRRYESESGSDDEYAHEVSSDSESAHESESDGDSEDEIETITRAAATMNIARPQV